MEDEEEGVVLRVKARNGVLYINDVSTQPIEKYLEQFAKEHDWGPEHIYTALATFLGAHAATRDVEYNTPFEDLRMLTNLLAGAYKTQTEGLLNYTDTETTH